MQPAQPTDIDARTLHLARRALADSNTAEIEGHIYDTVHHEVAPGVTVVAIPAASPRDSHVAISDDNGDYTVSDLRPGTYAVTLYLADFTTAVHDLDVAAGFATRVDLTIDREVHARGEPLHTR